LYSGPHRQCAPRSPVPLSHVTSHLRSYVASRRERLTGGRLSCSVAHTDPSRPGRQRVKTGRLRPAGRRLRRRPDRCPHYTRYSNDCQKNQTHPKHIAVTADYQCATIQEIVGSVELAQPHVEFLDGMHEVHYSWRSRGEAWADLVEQCCRNAALSQISSWVPNWVMTRRGHVLDHPSRSPAHP